MHIAYNSNCYNRLQESEYPHDWTDWRGLAEQLSDLEPIQREKLSKFLGCIPPAFSMGPADAVEVFKNENWFSMIDKLKSFENVGISVISFFEKETNQKNQLDFLMDKIKDILQVLLENHNYHFP